MANDREVLLKTNRFRVEHREWVGRDGSLVQRAIVRHPGSVVVLPVCEDEKVCLIKNYRVSVEDTLIELPAGTLEPNEAPVDCARRELIEETGLRAASIQPLLQFLAAPGILDENMHLFLASEISPGQPAREASEQIENYFVSLDEALEMVRCHQIRDAKTIVGLMFYDRFVRRT